MLKRQREVLQHQLDAEEKVLKELERHYRMALDDVGVAIRLLQSDEQTASRINRIKYQKTLQAQLEGILEKLHLGEYKSLKQYLEDCYTDAFIGTMYDIHGQGVPVIAPVDQKAAVKAIQLDTKLADRKIHQSATGEMMALYESLGIDTDMLKKTIRSEITRGMSTGMTFDDIARNISNVSKAPLSRAKTIARTEGHRIQQASTEDARQAARAKGADVVKQWDSTLDGATRKTHRALDGQIKEVNEPFQHGSKKAMYPGGFGDPAEDCNCRCAALTRARAALDEDELKTMQQRAAFFGLAEEKKQSFEDFREKYLKAAEALKNQGKSGIIPLKVFDPSTGEYFKFAEGTRIKNPKVFAGSGGVKPLLEAVADGLSKEFGGSPERWQHAKGDGTLDYYGEEREAEVHWFQEDSVGKVKFKVKRWMD